ncbi:MAG: hypothetical protein RR332_03800, partial [Clostridiales bacterium]
MKASRGKPCLLLLATLLTIALLMAGCQRSAVRGTATDTNNRLVCGYICNIDRIGGTIEIDELEQVAFNNRERIDALNLDQ